MRQLPPIKTEVAVIGAGAAGSVCAWNLRRHGISPIIISRGTSATEMSSGCIRFGNAGQLGKSGPQLPRSDEACQIVEDFLIKELARSGLNQHGSWRTGEEYVTGEGTYIVENIVPSPIFNGRAAALEGLRVGAILFPGGTSFDASLFSRSLSHHLSVHVEVAEVDIAEHELATGSPSTYLESIAKVAREMQADLIFIPPFLPLGELEDGLAEISRRSGRRIAEPVQPLGVQGRRLSEAMKATISRSEVRLITCSSVDKIGIDNDEVVLDVVSGHSHRTVVSEAAVFCGGGIVGGGLSIEGRKVIDPLRAMDIAEPELGSSSITEFVMMSGIRTDPDLAVHIGGSRISNIFAAGGCLPGASVATGGGIGTAMATAVMASQSVLEVLR